MKRSVWIPLRAIQEIQKNGDYGYLGYKREFFGTGTLAVPINRKDAVSTLGWMDIGISYHHSGFFDNSKYIAADVYEDDDGKFLGVHLVLDQHLNGAEVKIWHLHQDILLTLGLKREKDVWICPREDYTDVARIRRGKLGQPILLEMRAEYLKDYLCARNMGLYATSYYSRELVIEDASFITWKDGSAGEKTETDRWKGHVIGIHEGGQPFGAKTAVFHVSRTDVDESDDIPDISSIPTDQNIKSNSWESSSEGKKLYIVMGELWRNEWLEPAKVSSRIRRDPLPPSVFFVVDEEGNKETKETLAKGGRWLWFKPDVIMALAHRRGGALEWCTRDTGLVSCSPDNDVVFGINRLSLINVYAKDVALLPDWQQQIWAGYNVSPNGGVSEELLASQVRAQPAMTQSPEAYIKEGIEHINMLSQKHLNISLFREHECVRELIPKIHRFRAVDKSGFYALAKDVARLTADRLDVAAMQTIVSPPKNEKWGSLKTLENLLASKIGSDHAHSLMSALFGAYELRHADAHLPSSKFGEAIALLNIDCSLPTVFQGYQLLHACVSSIWGIVEVLQRWDAFDRVTEQDNTVNL